MRKSPSRSLDIPSALLLVFAVLVSSWRLSITNWTPHIGFVSNMALAGALVGLALGYSNFGKAGIRLLVVGYTLAFIPWQLTAFYPDKMWLAERLLGLGGRLLYSFSQYAADKPIHDELFLVFLLAMIYWFIGMSAGYALVRRADYLVAAIPSALALLLVHHYDSSSPGRIWFLAAYLAVILALLGRQQYLKDREAWDQKNVQLALETGQQLSTVAFVLAGALVLVAWLVPAHPSAALADLWDHLSEPWRHATERMDNAFASVEGNYGRTEYTPDSLALGSSANLDKSLIFTVTAPTEAQDLPRLYWRGRVYDHYEDGEWTSAPRTAQSFTPDDDGFMLPLNEKRDAYEFTFTSYIHDQSTLFVAGEPLWVSHPADARFLEIPTGGQDVQVLFADPFIQTSETYSVRSTIANPTGNALRQAGQNYPHWVSERYLQLPKNFPQTIRIYAHQITDGLGTPYEKAQAITTELRSKIHYQTTIHPPTDGRDLIEWFLFDGKQGYCNYYATAEVLMLRSIGIPARMAVGYARGESTANSGYLVRNENAHAWPEAYFPGYGWIEFEPTGNQPPLQRTEETPTNGQNTPGNVFPRATTAAEDSNLPSEPATAEENNPQTVTSPSGPDWSEVLRVFSWVTVIALFGFGLFELNRYSQRARLVERSVSYLLTSAEKRGIHLPNWIRKAALYILLDPIERSYNVINRTLKWLGKPPALHYTPADRAAALTRLMPQAAEEIETLQRELQATLYSPRAGNLSNARLASQRIFWKSLRAVIRKRWA